MAPPKRDTKAIMVRLHAATLEAIDDLIDKADDQPSRPEMVRRVLKQSLRDQGYDVREWID
ncbi:hypothetical protein MWU52_05355 [Jannaschia sp. S6380]|uniref:hypothetical protein n=1 Tax=Jannaschia sp. S6380 TaxID=2926408 RepID=UPI001FF56887|nr:hypothetical protein [Jannaschia sp. S6380]MCK0166973.1 hypothetical protein [Jannaschia sp. S6380]